MSTDSAERIVARLGDIAEPGALEFSVGEGDWPFRGFVVRWQGEVFVYANVCPHARHPLNLDPEGFFTPDRQQLICSSHGAVFDPATGECTGGPCHGDQLRRLPSRVVGGDVLACTPDSRD